MSSTKTMTNCDDTKMALEANPNDVAAAAHVQECPDCKAYREDMLAFDAKLNAAMDIPVPKLELPELPEIESSDNVVSLQKRRIATPPVWLAMAATVLVAVFVGIRMSSDDHTGASLETQLLAHIEHEPYAMQVSAKAVSDSRLARVVPANIATMDHEAGLITYAQSCTINGHEVPHLVIQGKNGPITILLMPEEMVAENSTISGETVEGVILKVGDGSVAIIGEKAENLEDVKQEILDSVKWSST